MSDKNPKDIFVIDAQFGKTGADRFNFVYGPHEVIEGYYGPVTYTAAQRFQLARGGERIRVGTSRELLLMFGLVEPVHPSDFEFLAKKADEFLALAARGEAKAIFTEGTVGTDKANNDTGQDKGSVKNETSLENTLKAKSVPVIPVDEIEKFKKSFRFHEARKLMLDAGFDIYAYGLPRVGIKKDQMMALYYEFLNGTMSL